MKNNEQRAFWEKQNIDIHGMMLNEEAETFEDLERNEILAYLPELDGLRILEPAAGIGRFTEYFASRGSEVTALDFVEKFIDENKNVCTQFGNVSHCVSDIMDIDFEPDSFDLIFVNWLLMYIKDGDLDTLIQRFGRWLVPGGYLFLRESCVSPSNPDAPHPCTYYRDPEIYERLLSENFETCQNGCIDIYRKRYNNPNQRWWLLQSRG